MAQTGVYPCYKNQFQLDGKSIADMETFGVSFDNGVEEWSPFETEGWVRRLMTAKALTISVTGKRNAGDEGNDAVAALYSKNGRDVEKPFTWTFPDGSKVELAEAVINVTNIGAGDSTGVAPLEFEVMSNGKPTFTPAV
ncbi:MAG: phage tail tube protein [Breznakia sp.]